MSVEAEIIAIGNELLLGMVQDTNTHWLCRQITGLGGRVQRCTIVPDELNAIEQELKRALQAGRALIVTTGGLGPTPDDMTLLALARTLGVPLKEGSEALAMIERRYRELVATRRMDEAELTESRRKMARLPRGAIPLANQVGTAPGVLLKHEKTVIISLPGVPPEMRDIWQNALKPHLKALFGKAFYLEKTLLVALNDESRIAPLLKEFQMAWPQVYLKSRPKGFEEGILEITVAMSGERRSVEETFSRLAQALKARLGEEGLRAEWI